MSKVSDYIKSIFATRKNYHVLQTGGYTPFSFGVQRLPFGEVIFLNITEILTDLYNEVKWMPLAGYDTPKYKAWTRFMQYNGQRILHDLYTKSGFAVIGWKMIDGEFDFWQLKSKEYTTQTKDDEVIVKAKDPSISFYVLKSPTFEAVGKSDREVCKPYIKYLDNVFNGSNAVSERLGVVVAASPKDPANISMPIPLDPEEKKELEKELQTQYGNLGRQNLIMLLPRAMDFQTINLAGLDQRTEQKALLAIKIICDRIKVPANQVAVIDATSSRSLSNGTELREGDLAKYRSFRRLLNATFFDFATEIGLKVDYIIENEPRTTQGDTIEK